MKRRTEGHPILPIEVFWDLYDAFGDAISTEILDRVQERRINVEEAKRYLKYARGKESVGKGNVCLYSFWEPEAGMPKRTEHGMVMWM
ncbi:MAG: hypothetical protein IJJ25_01965 [Lachnospiraceae bacterium]|nr:hypothetical protein [Lachnospiraceae bacterium]